MPLIDLEPPATPSRLTSRRSSMSSPRACCARDAPDTATSGWQEMTASVVRRTDLRPEEADQDGGHDPRP